MGRPDVYHLSGPLICLILTRFQMKAWNLTKHQVTLMALYAPPLRVMSRKLPLQTGITLIRKWLIWTEHIQKSDTWVILQLLMPRTFGLLCCCCRFLTVSTHAAHRSRLQTLKDFANLAWKQHMLLCQTESRHKEPLWACLVRGSVYSLRQVVYRSLSLLCGVLY